MERIRGCEVMQSSGWVCTEHWSEDGITIHVATSTYGDGGAMYGAWTTFNNNPDDFLPLKTEDTVEALRLIRQKFIPLDLKKVEESIASLQSALQEIEQL